MSKRTATSEALSARGKANDSPPLRKTKVLFLNRSYWPDAEATGQLLTELCEDLAGDLDIRVICGQPNQNPDSTEFRRCGVQVRNRVRIQRVPHTMFNKRWRRRYRALNMLTFLLTASLAALCGSRPDVVVVETDPPLLSLLGRVLQRLRGCLLVVYLQDIYPDVAKAMCQLPRWFPYGIVHNLLYRVYRRADQVIVLSRDMESHLIKSGVEPERIRVVSNWVDTRSVYPVKFANSFRRDHGLNDRFVVMYSGNMGLSQNLDHVLKAASLLQERGDIVFALIGDGASRKYLENMAETLELRNVRFFDYQPRDQLAQSLSAADLQLVILNPALAPFLMPSKIYSVLASGTPSLVVTNPNCELAQLVESEDVGLVVPPGDVNTLAAKICFCADNAELMRKLGIRARGLAVDRFDRDQCIRRLHKILTGQDKSGMTSEIDQPTIREHAT